MEHRYYIGFQLPEALSKDIQVIQQALYDPTIMQRPLEPHITMLPPPAVERVEPEELVRQVRVTGQPFWPLRLTLANVTSYKDHAITIHVDGQPIYGLQKRLISLLPPEVEVLYYPSPQFTPHVTLAQVQRGKKLPPELIKEYEKRLKDLLPASFDATELTIFKWIAPRRYTAHSI